MSRNELPLENVYGHKEKVCFFRSVIDNVRKKQGRNLNILDVGCGNGWAVTQHLGTGGDQVTGIDFHQQSIEFAMNHLSRPGLKFRCLNGEELQNCSEQYDIIVFADVLEHLESPKPLLNICHFLLDESGKILVSVPNGFGPFEFESALSKLPFFGKFFLNLFDFFIAFLNKFIMKGKWTKSMSECSFDLPYNDESPHVQFMGQSGWIKTIEDAGFSMQNKQNLSFISGPFTNYLFNPSNFFCKLNVAFAKKIPPFLSSSWVFEFSKKQS